jgi:Tol biopolymer transport system component
MFPDQDYRKILLSLLFLLGITALTSCASTSNQFGIVFTNSFSGQIDIYRIPNNTQHKIEQLTFTPTIGEYVLSVSNNGEMIVFSTEFYSRSEMKPSELATEKLRHIYLLETISMKLVDITSVLEDKYAQVGPEFYMDTSPDQKQFVVIDYSGTGYEIESFLEFTDFDGTNRKDVLIPTTDEIPSLINGVKWSPDGRKFALTKKVIGIKQQWENPGAAILIYDLESGSAMQITDYKDHCVPREWSPTSQQIVATCSYVPPYSAEGASGPETVRIFDVEKHGQPYEHISFSPCYDPSWSPDGKQIAFVCDKGNDLSGLFIINSDGNGIHEMRLGNLGNPAILKEPIWSPVGMQIVYVAGSDYEHTNIYAINSDSSNNHSLTNQDAFYRITSVYSLP